MLSTRMIVIGALVAITGTARAASADDDQIEIEDPVPAPKPAAPRPAAPAAPKDIDNEIPPVALATAPAGDDGFHKGTLGLAFPFTLVSTVAGDIQGGADRVTTIDLIYFVTDRAALDVIGGINFHHAASGAGGSSSNLFGFAIGAGYRRYSATGSLRSFIEPQVVLVWPNTSIGATLAVDAGLAFGLERTLAPWLSISGAIGAALDFTNRFKDIQVATSANLAANLYWH